MRYPEQWPIEQMDQARAVAQDGYLHYGRGLVYVGEGPGGRFEFHYIPKEALLGEEGKPFRVPDALVAVDEYDPYRELVIECMDPVQPPDLPPYSVKLFVATYQVAPLDDTAAPLDETGEP